MTFHVSSDGRLSDDHLTDTSDRPVSGADEEGNENQTFDILRTVWEQRRDSILGRVSDIEEAVTNALEGNLEPHDRRLAEREAHKLAGSVATFGFASASRIAKELEGALAENAALDQATALPLAQLVVRLRYELERSPDSASTYLPSRAVVETPGPLLLIVEDDEDLVDLLTAEAVTRGLRVATALTLSSARDVLGVQRPDAVLLDLSFDDDEDDGLALLAELTQMTPPVPVMVLTVRDAFVDRVEVARRGGRGFLKKSLSPAVAVDAVVDMLERLRASEAKVVAVDDDENVLATLKSLLHPHGVELTTVRDPNRFWEVLDEVSPDLILLDVDMPDFNGIDLCRVVRNDQRWRHLPVVFLTSRTDADIIKSGFAAGADDFVTKPVVGPELVARITNRLERIHLYRVMAESDPLTGVSNRRKCEQVIEQFMRLSDRYREPLCVAVVDLDHFKQINDQHGHATGDAVLRRLAELMQEHFRGEDVVSRWGGEEFVLGMYALRREDAVTRVADLLECLRDEQFVAGSELLRVSFSAGIAQYPDDGTNLPALYRAADKALYQAKRHGRDRVLAAGTHAHTRDSKDIDVVIVEDDENLAKLLLHSLHTRGYHTHWIANGRMAHQSLAGRPPSVKAKVVVLDVDLPGLDGFAVLGALAETMVLSRTRVIMLTGRSSEQEVLRALEMGAFDHVAKPFSLPVLMQHIRRAMETQQSHALS
jgi:diguanylate cyclase (GGDEF)-like protein